MEELSRRIVAGDPGAKEEWKQGEEGRKRLWQALDSEEESFAKDENQEKRGWKQGVGEGATWQGSVMDLVGGLRAWSVQVDPDFPQY